MLQEQTAPTIADSCPLHSAPKKEHPNWDMRQRWQNQAMSIKVSAQKWHILLSHFISQNKSYGQASHGESAFGGLEMHIAFTAQWEGRKKSKCLHNGTSYHKGNGKGLEHSFYPSSWWRCPVLKSSPSRVFSTYTYIFPWLLFLADALMVSFLRPSSFKGLVFLEHLECRTINNYFFPNKGTQEQIKILSHSLQYDRESSRCSGTCS